MYRCIRPYLDLHTAKTIATSIVQSKLDYCNSLYYGLPKYQINHLHYIQNALAWTVVQTPFTPFWNLFTGLKFLNELNIKSSLSLTKFSTPDPLYLYDLVSIQSPHGHNTRSSPFVTLIKPSSLKVTHRSFRHASPHLWNQLPTSLRIPHPNYSSPSQRPSFEHAGLTCYTLLSLSHCFTLSLKPTFSENLILHLSLFLSVGLISWL